MEIGQCDAAIDRVPPVGELVVRVKPGVKVLFAVFKLDGETEGEAVVSRAREGSNGNSRGLTINATREHS